MESREANRTDLELSEMAATTSAWSAGCRRSNRSRAPLYVVVFQVAEDMLDHEASPLSVGDGLVAGGIVVFVVRVVHFTPRNEGS